MLELGISPSAWRKGIAISSYRTSRNKKKRFHRKYRQILMESKPKKYYKQNKKQPTVRISSLSNLNIRIVDIVMIQWVRSTYFFDNRFFKPFQFFVIGIIHNRKKEYLTIKGDIIIHYKKRK